MNPRYKNSNRYLIQSYFHRFLIIAFLSSFPSLDGESLNGGWGGIGADEDGNVNTGDWLGWISVEHQPWLWSWSLSQWVYAPDPGSTASGAWTYLMKQENRTELLLHLFEGDMLTVDSSSHRQSVSVMGGRPGESEFEGSYFFDGIDDYLEISDFNYGPVFSLAFWFNSSENAGTQYQYMYSHGTIHQPNSFSVYFTEDDQEDRGAIKSNLLDSNDLDDSRIFNTPRGLSDGTWHFYAIAVDPEGTTVYLDGEPYLTRNQGGDAINPLGNIIVGGRNDKMRNRYYEGYLDDLRLYDGKLSSKMIAGLYFQGRQ